ncbi:MAG: flagellar hook-length control protein FliK [Myxococcaceae bacterium]|nr:flagellar hook-length control protein FliK [Myxococcaceae bacterium]
MSRVEDDRQAARLAERQVEARRNEEAQRGKKSAEASTFKKLVGQSQTEAQQAQARAQQAHVKDPHAQENIGKSAIAMLLESSEAQQAEETKGQTQKDSAFKSRLGSKTFGENVKQATRHEGEQGSQVRQNDQQTGTQQLKQAGSDKATTSQVSEHRKADAKVGRDALEERHEASESSSLNATSGGVGGARGEKGGLKADADKGGGSGGGQGGKDEKGGAGAMQPGFRFNPALMAPVPVAKQKDVSGSERLRKVANELAQKIVEKVRVGTNAAGKVEFQVDLRSDVLKGLSVKISSHNGKIKAVFQGSDRDVLKLVEEQKEALTQALSARGLSLEDFKVEGR